jgi:hypothetical protein
MSNDWTLTGLIVSRENLVIEKEIGSGCFGTAFSSKYFGDNVSRAFFEFELVKTVLKKQPLKSQDDPHYDRELVNTSVTA